MKAECALCKKPVTLDGDKRRFAAVEICMKDSADPRVAAFSRLQAGRYETGKTYYVCMECYLKNLKVPA